MEKIFMRWAHPRGPLFAGVLFLSPPRYALYSSYALLTLSSLACSFPFVPLSNSISPCSSLSSYPFSETRYFEMRFVPSARVVAPMGLNETPFEPHITARPALPVSTDGISVLTR
jgi:hypothetical protein